MWNSTLDLLTPDDCTLVLIDYQPQMRFAVADIDRPLLCNNVRSLAKSARVFQIPTILTAVRSTAFSGYIWPELLAILPDSPVFARSSMDAWEDAALVAEIERIGRKKLIFAGLWTAVCVMPPVLEAIGAGYQAYFISDASCDASREAYDMAVQRMTEMGAMPRSWLQVAHAWQQDWESKQICDEILTVLTVHAGTYGQGIEYAFSMIHDASPDRRDGQGK